MLTQILKNAIPHYGEKNIEEVSKKINKSKTKFKYCLKTDDNAGFIDEIAMQHGLRVINYDNFLLYSTKDVLIVIGKNKKDLKNYFEKYGYEIITVE